MRAEIVADSITATGHRLTTFVLEYPRFIHAELLTHRVFSRNSSSSRAIPIEKMITHVQEKTAFPSHWGQNTSGMQAHDRLSPLQEAEAKREWIAARDLMIQSVKKLHGLGLHKQVANRLLEPWQMMRTILSGTEFQNFFALRAHKDAQPELQELALLMLRAYNDSQPVLKKVGEWHVPFGDKIDHKKLNRVSKDIQLSKDKDQNIKRNDLLIQRIAIARCARVSYLNFEGQDDYLADLKLYDRLVGSTPRHLSPTEHVAQAQPSDEWFGNFRGWKQHRYLFQDQSLLDSRVLVKSPACKESPSEPSLGLGLQCPKCQGKDTLKSHGFMMVTEAYYPPVVINGTKHYHNKNTRTTHVTCKQCENTYLRKSNASCSFPDCQWNQRELVKGVLEEV